MKKTIVYLLLGIASCLSLFISPGCNKINPFTKEKQITVCFVPLDGISKSQIEELKKDFQENFTDKREEVFFVESLEHFNTSDSCINRKYNRFEAGTMLKFLNNQFGESANKIACENSERGSSDYYIIGVTNKDISKSNLHNKPNYGILGKSTLGGNVSVISTYRLKNKKELWKLAMHEFGHGYFNLNHCENDDPSCIMADAKGGNPHFELKDTLCSTCYEKSLRPDIIRKIIN
ncbi:MAG: hypothetical protein J1E16_10570 [Muribaculaceae bacterium]|nr:hypothetical protein [Muribaculaceae bacterium]